MNPLRTRGVASGQARRRKGLRIFFSHTGKEAGEEKDNFSEKIQTFDPPVTRAQLAARYCALTP
jgi:hypothetical protein